MISRHSPYYAGWFSFHEGKYIMCVSNEIINEYLEIIGRLTNGSIAANVVDTILRSPNCKRIDPQFRFGLIKQDVDDNKFVDCAIMANADYIVSEDSHFKELRNVQFPRVNVMTIGEFIRDIDG